MPCSVTNGRALPCKSGVGGLKSIYFAPYTSTTAALTDSSGTITLDDSVSFYKYEIKGNSSLETAINSSRENGSTFYESTLNVTFTFIDVATQEQIKLLSHGRPQIVIEDYNGNHLCSFECITREAITKLKNCNIADIDEDEYGLQEIRIQLEEEE